MYIRFFKRFFDIMFSLFIIMLFSWLYFIIFVLVKITSKGPAIFKQDRLTINGKIFKMYKFRSMVVNAEKSGTGLFNYQDDVRVTKFGRILRKTSLDELPQLFNVLKGDMSIVGPRPSVVNELGPYENLNSKFKKRFEVKAGITGLAQISGRNDLPWDKKIDYDSDYVDRLKKHGIFTDIRIFFGTFFNIFKSKQIYEKKDESLAGLADEEIAKIENERIIAMATAPDNENNIGESEADNIDYMPEDKVVASEDKAVTSEDKVVASEDKAVTSEDKTVTSEDKAVASEDKAVTSEDKAVASEDIIDVVEIETEKEAASEDIIMTADIEKSNGLINI